MERKMKATVIGHKDSRFTPEGETREVVGLNVFLVYEDAGATGKACERAYFKESILLGQGKPPIGAEIRLNYNRWGKVESYDLLHPPK